MRNATSSNLALFSYASPHVTRALPLFDRSGEPVQVDAAKYVTYHDAEGIGAFLDSDFDELSSIVSFTIDYLAGSPLHVDSRLTLYMRLDRVPQPRACGVICSYGEAWVGRAFVTRLMFVCVLHRCYHKVANCQLGAAIH